MNISIKTRAVSLLAILAISSIALHSRAACNPPGVAEVDVILESVTFSNDNVVYTDAGTPYIGTDWETSKRQPVSYKSGETLKVQATWTLGREIDDTDWRVRGVLTAGEMSFSSIGGSTTKVTADKKVLTLAATAADMAFLANMVQYHAHFKIEWEFSFDKGVTWKDCSEGVSDNQMYITHEAPSLPLMRHSVIHISCSGGDGCSTPTTIVDGIYEQFSTLQNHARAADGSDGTLLTYRKLGNNAPDTVSGLLEQYDGSCIAWAEFFKEALLVQKISSSVKEISPINSLERLFVGCRASNFINPGADACLDSTKHAKDVLKFGAIFSGSDGILNTTCHPDDIESAGSRGAAVTYPYVYSMDVWRTGNHVAQGVPDSPYIFGTHTIVLYGTNYYDPSYGTFKGTLDEYESDMIFGYGIDNGAGVFYIRLDDSDTDIK